jgi:3-deoxy-D-manno-octulosonic acid kinase
VIPTPSHDIARSATPDGAILFDARRFPQAGAQLLDPAHWPGAQPGNASGGRGAVWFVRGPFGQGVLRHYRRGGLVGRVNRDRYWWHGEDRTRSFREFRLLHELARRGLRVPQPLAAGYARDGLSYRADLLTALVPNTRTLAQRLAADFPSLSTWDRLGATLGRFHAEGVFHADLNAHNVLIDPQHDAWLIDFDRGELRAPARAWQRANLQRLQRSLHKLGAPSHERFAAAWDALVQGYAHSQAAVSAAGAT